MIHFRQWELLRIQTCPGDNNGAINVLALGGGGFYEYNWSNGDTTALATDLAAGTYTITISDCL